MSVAEEAGPRAGLLSLRSRAERHRAAYDPEGEVNVPGYLGSLAAFGTIVFLGLLAGRARGQELPERYDLRDLVLGAWPPTRSPACCRGLRW